jgi:hypothetical protein
VEGVLPYTEEEEARATFSLVLPHPFQQLGGAQQVVFQVRAGSRNDGPAPALAAK